VILDLRLEGVESERSWLEAVHSLVERKLGCPVLAVIDGNPGPGGGAIRLRRAIRAHITVRVIPESTTLRE